MIPRYSDPKMTAIWSDENKFDRWQKVELAIIEARTKLRLVSGEIFFEITNSLEQKPINIERINAIERETNHDMIAFVKERKENLVVHLRRYFHDVVTSYDIEEPALALILIEACHHVLMEIAKLDEQLVRLAKRYCFTPMNARTHGQEAEVQSFGARCLTWLAELRFLRDRLEENVDRLEYSKISGAIGKYNAKLTPELEETALGLLGLKTFSGATQIIPRSHYIATAQVLCNIVQVIEKIAHDIRLSARSGKPLMQEPFGKKQTGSSAMPQKKNPIGSEKLSGMSRLAQGYLVAIQQNLFTWEERAIEQSSCERIVWPDLCHVTVHSIVTLTKILTGLRVYPDNMLWEIKNSRGCYAAAQAKDWLKEKGEPFGIDEEAAYRIVQLAAFNAHEPGPFEKELRSTTISSMMMVDSVYFNSLRKTDVAPGSIEGIISSGLLRATEELSHAEYTVANWNRILRRMFNTSVLKSEWSRLFDLSSFLIHEKVLFKKILDWTPCAEDIE